MQTQSFLDKIRKYYHVVIQSAEYAYYSTVKVKKQEN